MALISRGCFRLLGHYLFCTCSRKSPLDLNQSHIRTMDKFMHYPSLGAEFIAQNQSRGQSQFSTAL